MKITHENLNQKDLIDNLFKMGGRILTTEETSNTINDDVVKNILNEIKKTNETKKQEWVSSLTEGELKMMILSLTAHGAYINDELPKQKEPITFSTLTNLKDLLPPVGPLVEDKDAEKKQKPKR